MNGISKSFIYTILKIFFSKLVKFKRHAILYHQYQNDRVMFQGNDSREFWIRAEDGNKHTSKLYNDLGLAEYVAIEVFKRFEY